MRVPRPSPDVVFCLAIAALFAGALVASLGFRAQARLFPTVIAIVGLGLALLQLVMELRKQRVPAPVAPAVVPFGSGEGTVEAIEDRLPPGVRRRRTAAILGWVFGFALAVWLVGFSWAVPLCTLAYARLDARESWLTSIIFAAASGAVFYGLFLVAIRIPFDGLTSVPIHLSLETLFDVRIQIPFDEGRLVTLVLDALATEPQ